jgi:hypothetical protein
MRKIFSLIYLLLSVLANAQSDDTKRIALNAFVSDNITLPEEAKSLLLNKLSTMATQYAMAGSEDKPRFILTAHVTVLTKDVVSGPPALIAQTLQITFYIGDAIDDKAFSSMVLNSKGVGTNENKAFIDAFKNIPTQNPSIEKFMRDGKEKILAYYVAKCPFIEQKAASLAAQGNFDEAIYELAAVPEVSSDCYTKSRQQLSLFFQQKIDNECKQKLTRAKAIWAGNLSYTGARDAGNLVMSIHPSAACQPEVASFLKSMSDKIAADERAAWEQKVKQYQDQVARENLLIQYAREDAARAYELSKIRSENFRQIALEFARHLPKSIVTNNYNRIRWW